MQIDNPKVRAKIAENAAKRSGPGQWEVICKDLDEDDSKMFRHAMVFLAEPDNDALDQILSEINENVGEKYAQFIRRYNKAYRETEASMAKAVTVKKADVAEKKEEAPELTVEDRELIESLKKELAERPTVATFDRYAEMIKPWSSMKAQLATESLGEDAISELTKQRRIKTARHQKIEEAKKEIGDKIPKSEIDTYREPGPDHWDIDVEIFYPIALGVVTGRVAAIAEAIETFGYVFDGRGLSELTGMATLLMLERWEGKESKLQTFYSAIVVKLSTLSGDDEMLAAATRARYKMEELLNITDEAGALMAQLAAAVIEEGE